MLIFKDANPATFIIVITLASMSIPKNTGFYKKIISNFLSNFILFYTFLSADKTMCKDIDILQLYA